MSSMQCSSSDTDPGVKSGIHLPEITGHNCIQFIPESKTCLVAFCVKSSVTRQKGLTTSHIIVQLDPFASKLTKNTCFYSITKCFKRDKIMMMMVMIIIHFFFMSILLNVIFSLK